MKMTTPREQRAVRKASNALFLAVWMIACLSLRQSVAAAPTQNEPDLDIKLVALKVLVKPDGKEQLDPADRAFPGEVIQYEATYRDRGGKGIANLKPTLPIPVGMHYIPSSAQPAPVEASLDGQRFEPIPLKRKVTLPSGEVQEQEVSATEYRALRWHLGDIEAGAKTTLVARTRLIPVLPEPSLTRKD